MYNKDKAIEAWKTFVNSGVLIEDYIRPEIARSWQRCREQGLDPWSTDFDSPNVTLLDEKRKRFVHSLHSTAPVMKFLLALLGCNVSLMDGENFVFELLTPMAAYPRTFGTFMRESRVGTGNATVVAYEKKPVRVEGFEQYRAIAQSYSGVSAPFLDSEGGYFGALNLNSPFETLPQSALALCTKAVDLANELHLAGAGEGILLSTVEYFKPLMLLYENPTLLMDAQGRILSANAAMHEYCPGWEDYSYGSQSLDAYLGRGSSVDRIKHLPEKLEAPEPMTFKKPRTRSEKTLNLLRHGMVDAEGMEPFFVLVFQHETTPAKKAVTTPTERLSVPKLSESDEHIDYIGESSAWHAVDAMVQKVAKVNANVLLLGETGAGKEVVARALHRRSGRQGEFVPVNCGAIPRDLLATELFGYEAGAFTGAKENGSIGKFEYANGGTLFLDEIGEMPMDMQVTLLRVLQDRSVTKLGSNVASPLDVRVIAATNQDIAQLIKEKQFRSDLYYRLSLMEISLPPLRARADDVPRLVEYFNQQLSLILNMPCTPFPHETLEVFMGYSWPGNVRELRNFVERSLIMQGGGAQVTEETLPTYMARQTADDSVGLLGAVSGRTAGEMQRAAADPAAAQMVEGAASAASRAPLGRSEIAAALEKNEGNISLAAKELGISRKTLYRRMEEQHLKVRVVVEEV